MTLLSDLGFIYNPFSFYSTFSTGIVFDTYSVSFYGLAISPKISDYYSILCSKKLPYS